MRYLTAVLAACTFAFTGHPTGLRLITALAIANLTMTIWAHVKGEVNA